MRIITIEEFLDLKKEIINSYQITTDRNCPVIGDIVHSDVPEKVAEQYHNSHKLNLRDLTPGSEIYLLGHQTYFTLKIEENKVKLWHEDNSNALSCPLDKIVTRWFSDDDGKINIEEGVIRTFPKLIMPVVEYDDNSIKREVLLPNKVKYISGISIWHKKA
jgi:hypothetical protein